MQNETKSLNQLTEEFIAIIKANPNFKSFFKRYKPSSVDLFLHGYCVKKASMALDGKGFKDILDKHAVRWETEAKERLEEILQVKLFLFQCLYRAEALESPVEEIKTTFDFYYWEKNILNAHFVDPITESDIELYINFMNSPDGTHNPLDFLHGWQQYDKIKRAYIDDEDAEPVPTIGEDLVPAWYEFYFSRTGHGFEVKLPDTRGEKDMFYFQIAVKEETRLAIEAQQKAIKENLPSAPEKGEIWDFADEELIWDFLETFESKDDIGSYKVHEEWSKFIEKEDIIYEDLNMLLYEEEIVPIEKNENWMEGLLLTAANHRTKKIIESLPTAYAQYKMNLDLNITLTEKERSQRQREFYQKKVLKGRRLHGDPEDFNY